MPRTWLAALSVFLVGVACTSKKIDDQGFRECSLADDHAVKAIRWLEHASSDARTEVKWLLDLQRQDKDASAIASALDRLPTWADRKQHLHDALSKCQNALSSLDMTKSMGLRAAEDIPSEPLKQALAQIDRTGLPDCGALQEPEKDPAAALTALDKLDSWRAAFKETWSVAYRHCEASRP